MKKAITHSLFIVFLLTLQGCWYGMVDDDSPPPSLVSNYEPVIVTRAGLESTTKLETPRPIVNSGKIYVKDTYLFINEKNEGFHVFDNSDPQHPEKIAFITVLGATDLAIKGNILYINNATDLIAVTPDFTTETLTVTKRVPNTFPQMTAPDGSEYYELEEDEIIIDWILKK